MATLPLNYDSLAIRKWYSCFTRKDANYYWRIGNKTTIKTLRYSQWIFYS